MKKTALYKYVLCGIIMLLSILLYTGTGYAERRVKTINALYPGAMPCVGSPRIIVFYIEYPETDVFQWVETNDEINSMFFSEDLKYDTSGRYSYTEKDSLRSFYYRSSYGMVDITGDVYSYTAQMDALSYSESEIIIEIIDAFADKIDWDNYDNNSDGYIDGVYFISRCETTSWGSNHVTSFPYNIGNKSINSVAFIDSHFLHTIEHETYHMFGLPDIYGGVNVNLGGIHTPCIMGDGLGDIPGISKVLLGWISNIEYVTGHGEFTVNLQSLSRAGHIVVIPPNGDLSNPNWFIVEYITNENNNQISGIRIWQMKKNFDGEYNVLLEGLYAQSPYKYLDTLHLSGETNRLYHTGDIITPYTNPSTAYGAAYSSTGSACYISKYGYSGISIFIENTTPNCAALHISISDLSDVAFDDYLTIEFLDTITGQMISNTQCYMFAKISSTIPLAIEGELTLLCNGHTIPVIVNVENSINCAYLYISANDLSYISLGHECQLLLSDAVTVYGVPIQIADNRLTHIFSNIAIPLSEYGRFFWDMPSFNSAQELTYYQHDHKTYRVLYDSIDKGLYQIIIPDEQQDMQIVLIHNLSEYGVNMSSFHFWMSDENHYCIHFIADGVNGIVMSFDYLNNLCDTFEYKSSSIIMKNTDGLPIIHTSGIYQEVNTVDGTICINNLDFLSSIKSISPGLFLRYMSIKKNGDHIFQIVYEYLNLENNDIMYDSIEYNTLTNTYAQPKDEITYLSKTLTSNNDRYTFTISRNALIQYINLDQENYEKKILISDLPIIQSQTDQFDVTFIEDMFIVTFNAVDIHNIHTFKTTYILLFNLDGDLLYYYRNSNETDSLDYHVATPVYIGNKVFFMGENDSYYYVSLGDIADHKHIERIIKGVPPTCTETGLTEGVSCGICGAVLVEQETIPTTKIHYCENDVCKYCHLSFDINGLDVFALPASTQNIMENAFCGISAEAVIIPDQCVYIGPHAFSDCQNLRYVFITEDIEFIDATAFSGSTPDVIYQYSNVTY